MPRLTQNAYAFASILITVAFAVVVNGDTITIDDTGSFSYPYSNVPADRKWVLTSSDLGGFDPTGSDKLVLVVTGEKIGNSYDEISYNSANMTQITSIAVDTVPRNVQMYYLDNPPSISNLVVDLTGGNGVGLAIMALSNTQLGFVSSPSSTAPGTSTSITTTDANSLVVAAAVNNSSSVTVQAPLIELYSGDSGSAGHGSGYQQVPESGTTITPTFPDGLGVLAVEFLAVQPPAGTVIMIK